MPPPAFTSTGTQLQEQGRGAINRDLLLSPRVLVNTAKKLQFNQEQIVKIRNQDLKITFPGEAEEQNNNNNRPRATDQPQEVLLELTANSQAKAELFLETLMNEMVEYSRWINTSQLRARIEALSVRLNEVQKDLTRAEEKFYRYISTRGRFIGDSRWEFIHRYHQ
jgi:hypothetical protein